LVLQESETWAIIVTRMRAIIFRRRVTLSEKLRTVRVFSAR
jgi:hypothetical protein